MCDMKSVAQMVTVFHILLWDLVHNVNNHWNHTLQAFHVLTFKRERDGVFSTCLSFSLSV